MSFETNTTTDRRAGVAVLEAVADRDGVDPTELTPPLYDVVDPEALEALFAPTPSGAERLGRVTFTYRGYRVTVDSEGSIGVEESADEARESTARPEQPQIGD